MTLRKYLELDPKVSEALKNNDPVVALESTIISHGMPYPDNIDTANNLEDIIREQGAVPATIAIQDGKIKVGLNSSEIERLAKSEEASKVSRRDIPTVLAQNKLGATTVSATMIGAYLAGITVFATGGIGGVHREGYQTFDISADLQELAKTNVCVVCSGAKAILDLPLTLEYLETHGIPVLGYQTDEFPAFYSRVSGLKVQERVDTSRQAADIMKAKWELGLNGGIVLANPIPEKHALDAQYMEKIIESSLTEAHKNNITGKDVTPFLLSSLEKATEGKSLSANVELVKHNARVAADIAVSFHRNDK